MAEQLTGVLREVIAVADGMPRPAASTVFSPELQAIGTGLGREDRPLGPTASGGTHPHGPALEPPAAEIIAGLPIPQVDRADPGAGYLATFAGLGPGPRADALSRAVSGDPAVPSEVAASAETRLALARALLDIGDYDGAEFALAELAADDPSDWRIAWTDGLRRLAVGDTAAAGGAFRAVYAQLPGEVAPKLALAFAAEAGGDVTSASHYFRLVWMVDRSYVSAAFGLARTCLAAGDRPGAIAALAAVPDTSTHHATAQIAAVRILVSPGVTDDDLREADGRLGRLALDEARRQQLTVEILRAALDRATSGQTPSRPAHARHASGAASANGRPASGAASANGRPASGAASANGLILGCEPNERALRLGLERAYRELARLTSDPSRRTELVDMANAIRPMTWA